MSLACTLLAEPSRALRRLLALCALVGVSGLALASWYLLGGSTLMFPQEGWASTLAGTVCALAAALVLAGAVGPMAAARASAAGQLRISDSGQAYWHDEAVGAQVCMSSSVAHAAAPTTGSPATTSPCIPLWQPVCIRWVARLPGLIVLVLAPSDGRRFSMWFGPRIRVLLGQDAFHPDTWRRVNVWLCWLEREHVLASGRQVP